MLGEDTDTEVLESSQVNRNVNVNSLGKSKASAISAQQPEDSQQKVIQPEEQLSGAKPISPPATPISIGEIFRSPVKKAPRRNRIVRKLCRRIEQIQDADNSTELPDEIFTIPMHSTPMLTDIYNEAFDRTVSDEGFTGSSVVGV